MRYQEAKIFGLSLLISVQVSAQDLPSERVQPGTGSEIESTENGALAPEVPASEAPASEAPPSEAVHEMATLDLEWEVVEGAVGYQVKLVPLGGGETLLFSSQENKLSEQVLVGHYRLQIRSKDKTSGYFGRWSEETEVEVQAKVVEPLSPENEAVIAQATEKRWVVELQWGAVAGARLYTVRIWSDDPSKAKEFRTTKTTKKLSLPTGRTYNWQVTFEDKNSVGYQADPKTFTFSLLGPQLLQPVVNKATTSPHIDSASWSKSPGARYYHAQVLRRALDETEWKKHLEIEKSPNEKWSFPRLSPGSYRIEVSAHAPNRISSDVGFYEFIVKPTEQELAAALRSVHPAFAPDLSPRQIPKDTKSK